MASSKPPPKEAIVCVRVLCREGKERVWQAIAIISVVVVFPTDPVTPMMRGCRIRTTKRPQKNRYGTTIRFETNPRKM
jgi:hypothetical protein